MIKLLFAKISLSAMLLQTHKPPLSFSLLYVYHHGCISMSLSQLQQPFCNLDHGNGAAYLENSHEYYLYKLGLFIGVHGMALRSSTSPMLGNDL